MEAYVKGVEDVAHDGVVLLLQLSIFHEIKVPQSCLADVGKSSSKRCSCVVECGGGVEVCTQQSERT